MYIPWIVILILGYFIYKCYYDKKIIESKYKKESYEYLNKIGIINALILSSDLENEFLKHALKVCDNEIRGYFSSTPYTDDDRIELMRKFKEQKKHEAKIYKILY